MSESRKDPDFGRRYQRINDIVTTPLVLLFVFLMFRGITGGFDGYAVVALSVFAVGCAVGLVYQNAREHGYKCRECGKPIPEPVRYPQTWVDAPMSFHCDHCDVTWETDLLLHKW